MADELVQVARDGDTELLKALIASGASLNEVNREGDTALCCAVDKGRVDCVQLLLEAKADVDLEGSRWAPLYASANRGRAECMRMLLNARANVNARNYYGATALHRAVSYHSVVCVQILLEARAVVRLFDNAGQTPLYRAIVGGEQRYAEMLLDAGAKLSNLKTDQAIPEWMELLMLKRQRCRDCALALYGVLRKRWRVGGTRVPRDMINVLTRKVWDARGDARWAQEEKE